MRALNPKPYCRRYSLRDPVGARAESLLLPASFESFSSAASVASSVSAAMSPSSDFFFLDSFFTVNRPSRFPGQACIALESGVGSDLPNFASRRVYLQADDLHGRHTEYVRVSFFGE